MTIVIGGARMNENDDVVNGKPGDQKQTQTPDMNGEVSLCDFYVHSKGWYIFRPKSSLHAKRIAKKMETACNNSNIGYDQENRLEIIEKGVKSKTKISCDCSSLVRACIKEGTGKDPGNFTTDTAASFLENSNLFEDKKEYVDGMELFKGDVLITKQKGHAAIIVQGNN